MPKQTAKKSSSASNASKKAATKTSRSTRASRTSPLMPTAQTREPDGTFLLKLVLYVVLGAVWLRFAHPVHIGVLTVSAFPLGLVVGLLFASREKFPMDRKIEYALLLIMTVMTFFTPAGIII